MSRRVPTNARPWEKVRRKALRRDNYLCCVCRRAVAAEVDHIIPAHRLKNAREELDLTNLQSICRACHREKTNNECRAAARDLTGLIDRYYV